MPYIRADAEIYDEIVSELGVEAAPGGRPSEDFQYESAEASFTRDDLGPGARAVYDALVGAGATQFLVKYDGGYDEGFSHPAAARFGEQEHSIEAVAKQLANPKLVKRLVEAAGGSSAWGNASEMYAKASEHEAVRYGLEELAHELASRLLGDGFGTGEYQLYGEFTADLKTGKITDHKDVQKPKDMME
jgi:hypothetical protein